MAIVAPHVRKPRSADALFHLVRSGFASLPDHRLDAADIAFTDALMSAFALLSLNAPSLLAFDKERDEGHLRTIYGIERVRCDMHMRAILDPGAPKVLRPVFQSVLRQLQRGKALEPMTFREDHSLLTLDGPEDFSSKAMHLCLVSTHSPPQRVDHRSSAMFGQEPRQPWPHPSCGHPPQEYA